MRVCELAKNVKASSVEVLRQADRLDIEVYSALSQLEDDDVSRLREAFGQRTAEEIAKSIEEQAQGRADKRARALSMRSAQDKTILAVLDANRARALEMDAAAKGLPPPGATASETAPAAASTAPAETAAAAEPAGDGVAQAEGKTDDVAADARPAEPAKEAETSAKPGAKTKTTRHKADEDLEP
ncbi:MAG: translation initiation factor IF-2 N-terminal domain-containing protein, partial [Kiritimatiellae bacterium]|nr:translation initiation factor IF-2 N-terminal domain-containing protein [Kiritimatiellia bacterium]